VPFFEIADEKRHTGVVKTLQRHPGATTVVVAGRALRDHSGESDRTEGGTRAAVIRLLLDRPAAATEIAERLGISAAGVRRHLDALADEGAVTTRECRSSGPRGRGRPAREYLLTDAGRSKLPHAYDAIAVEALEFLDSIAGEDAVLAFARRRAEALLDSHRAALAEAADAPARIDILAGALTDAGFSATVAEVGVGRQLCQHHCPVAHVAAKFPQLCQAELEVFSDAIGSYSQRLATIANGDSFCTTFIPGAAQVEDLGTPQISTTPHVNTALSATTGRNPL